MKFDPKIGINRNEAAAFFETRYDIVLKLTKGLIPQARIAGQEYYKFREVAERLLIPDTDAALVDRLMKMSPEQLPDKLKTAYWRAKKLQQEYELTEKDLWRTAELVEYMGDAFKSIRIALQLMSDTVQRESSLTEPQRIVVQRLVDNTLNDMRSRMIDAFKNKRKSEKRKPAPREEDHGYAEL